MEFDNEIQNLLTKLKEKYDASGQDWKAYLEGLLHQNYLSYWDYIHTDTLLSLQKPRTAIPDEMIFIMYHQITELYFKLTLHEMEQISSKKDGMDPTFFAARLKRMTGYFKNLINSFEIMVEGMEPKQFLQFRMSLLPASGFQSAQYRSIEICATNFIRMVDKDYRDNLANASLDEQYKYIYWQAGATELATGKKTLTLTQFEEKYQDSLLRLAKDYEHKNLWAVYKSMSEEDQKNEELIKQLKDFDACVNVNWPLMHYKSAVRYLQKSPEDIAATGGTNWQKYLPPRIQKRIFYPELWNENEMIEWGKSLMELGK